MLIFSPFALNNNIVRRHFKASASIPTRESITTRSWNWSDRHHITSKMLRCLREQAFGILWLYVTNEFVTYSVCFLLKATAKSNFSAWHFKDFTVVQIYIICIPTREIITIVIVAFFSRINLNTSTFVIRTLRRNIKANWLLALNFIDNVIFNRIIIFRLNRLAILRPGTK